MNEKTTLEIIAPTVEEALAQGLSQLGLTADAVTMEVLDSGNKGLFGLGKPQVRVNPDHAWMYFVDAGMVHNLKQELRDIGQL
mgnify:CR=1 FL=1